MKIIGLIRRNPALVLGMSIPLLAVVFIAGSIYLPQVFIKPQFNFLYASSDTSRSLRQYYSVQERKLVKTENKDVSPEKSAATPRTDDAKFYVYDVTANEAREVSFEDAQQLNLEPGALSSDGFEITYGSGTIGPLSFFSSQESSRVRYLKGRNVSIKLNLRLHGSSYYGNFLFLGWIK